MQGSGPSCVRGPSAGRLANPVQRVRASLAGLRGTGLEFGVGRSTLLEQGLRAALREEDRSARRTQREPERVELAPMLAAITPTSPLGGLELNATRDRSISVLERAG